MPSPASDPGPLFSEAGAGTLRLVAYLGLAVVLMIADHRGRYADQLRTWTAALAGPVYRLAAAPVRIGRELREATAEREALQQDNARLREDLLLAQARLARLAAVQDQNLRLRELLEARTRLGLKAQLAELIEVDLDPFRHRLLIDQGADAGVHEGQAVMDARGVMGQILEVRPDRSVLILVTDAGHALPVTVLRTGLRTIAYGTGDLGTLRLPHVPFSADLAVGDQLVTSGIGGRFPSGLPVGVVREVRPDVTSTFVVAVATPAAGLSRSGEVLVLHEERAVLNLPGGRSYEFVGPPEALPVTAPRVEARATGDGGAQ